MGKSWQQKKIRYTTVDTTQIHRRHIHWQKFAANKNPEHNKMKANLMKAKKGKKDFFHRPKRRRKLDHKQGNTGYIFT